MYQPLSDTSAPPAVYVDAAAAPPSSAPLGQHEDADVAIIGAGFTGLSAALHLAQAGVRAVVLEAKQIGWGASGRAFGQVVPYLKHGPEKILARYGHEAGQRIIAAVAAGPDFVFDLIARHGIACDAVRTGLIFAGHSPSGQRDLEQRTAYWQQRGAPVEMLDAGATAEAIGSSAYAACSVDRRGGHLNPYGYAIGLAHAAAAAGARIHTGTQVRALTRAGGYWELDSLGTRLRAAVVIIATNAYSDDLWPGLRQNFVAMRGHGMVSAPLSENIVRSLLPGRQPLTDTRRLFSGVRVLAGGQLHVSLDGPAFGPESTPFIRKAEARVARLFPQLGPLRWQESWSGWIAVTQDHFPRVCELAPGVFSGFGYSGRGIAAATLIGRDLAARARGVTDGIVFPLSRPKPIALHRFSRLPAEAVLRAWRLLDAADDRKANRSQ